MYREIISLIEQNRVKTINEFKEEQFKVIWSSLNRFQIQSDSEVTYISQNIEKELLELPEDEFMKVNEDMNNNQHNISLHNIFMKNINGKSLNGINNHRNGILMMSNDGYLEDFNYRRADTHDEHELSFRSWEDSIECSYNQDLEKDAISKILNRTSGVIALESYDLTKNDNHIRIKELTYDNLLNVYMKEGIEGLRNYQIFVPYYITDIGDIFGNPDISQGIKTENNKIIIVQEFNLYDQLKGDSELFEDKTMNNVTNRYNNLIRLLYLFGIMIISGICIMIFILCLAYNTALDQELINRLEEENKELTETLRIKSDQ